MLFTAEVVRIDMSRRTVDITFPDGSLRVGIPYVGLTPEHLDRETLLAVCGNLQGGAGAIICLGFTLAESNIEQGIEMSWAEIHEPNPADGLVTPAISQGMSEARASLEEAVRACHAAYDAAYGAACSLAIDAGATESMQDIALTLCGALLIDSLQGSSSMRSDRAVQEVKQVYPGDERPTEKAIREVAEMLGVVVTRAKDGAEEWALTNHALMQARLNKG